MSFDRVARYYQLLETIAFGGALQRSRVYWIDKIPRPKRVLILGEGNGRFLCELMRIHPRIHVDCVDASGRMLQLARARVERTRPESLAHVRFLDRDILDWSPTGSYDVLVTHFFLDCFSDREVETIVTKLAGASQPDATWLLSDFAIPRQKIARLHATVWLSAMYAFFRFTSRITAHRLVDPGRYFQANGFVRESHVESRMGMLTSKILKRTETALRLTGLSSNLGSNSRAMEFAFSNRNGENRLG